MEISNEELQKQLDDAVERFNKLGEAIEAAENVIKDNQKKINDAVAEQRIIQGEYKVLANLLGATKATVKEAAPEVTE
jgi:septal ring factor EnvC (AmiA/AmiB activator)